MSAGVGYRKATPPKSKYVVDGVTVKFESYYSFWGSKLGVRTTTKTGETQDLITWEQLTDQARTALTDADFDVDWSFRKVVMPMSDDVFTEKLNKAYPF
ncbi:necrosis inducing-like protein NPP1 type [Phytophthora cinnamomi]|uniref:necrosis inducing-like protein NPP1 type n=1 Tax=Phytophthora cinnamomi TaxID=4785 RepID=UPI00355AA5C7|nr:necrosis inducing-like protein NPP1 type [Phytophthora cinnamomi]